MTSPNDLLCVLCGSSVGRCDSMASVQAITRVIGDGLPLKAGGKAGRLWHRACGSPAWNARPEVDARVVTNASALARSAVGWSAMGPVWADSSAPVQAPAPSGPSPAEVKALAELRAENLRLKAEQAGIVQPSAPKAAPVVKPTPAVDTSGMCWRDRRAAELAAKAAPVQATPAVAPPVLPPPAPPAPVQAPPMAVAVAPVVEPIAAPVAMVQPTPAPVAVQAMPSTITPVRIPVDRATYAALLRALELTPSDAIAMALDRAPIRLSAGDLGPVVCELVMVGGVA